MYRTLFTSTTRDELLSVLWTGHTRLELMLWPEIWRESGALEYCWSPSRRRPRVTQERLDSRSTGIIRIRVFPLLPGLPSAPKNSTLVALPIFRNSNMPDHFMMASAGWTSIFHGASLLASRSSTL